MRLGAVAQPAYIRMTRRRSVLPHPSSSIPEEDNGNGCPEGTHERHGHDLLARGLTAVVPYQLRGPRSAWPCADLVICNALFCRTLAPR